MSEVSEDAGVPEQPQITKQHLIQYVSGNLQNAEIWTAINREVKLDGSPIQQEVNTMRAKLRDPFNIDWGAIAAVPDDKEASEK